VRHERPEGPVAEAEVSRVRALIKPPWRRVVLLILLLIVALQLANAQQHAVAIGPELWVPADVPERTVG
jgi:hypothetical protein